MKRFAWAAMALLLGTPALKAQELPQPSPRNSFTQRVGLTDVEVIYSRPAVKDRVIFGDLVPYGEVWRTGANECTKFNTSTDITFGGKTLKAGEYALFAIPTENEWTVIISTQTNLWGSSGYDESGDVLRITTEPFASDFDENFTISFQNITTSSADLMMEWADVAVKVPVAVDAEGQSARNVARALAEANSSYRNAASFYSRNGEHDKAIETIQSAVNLDPSNWYTQWVMAEILQRAGKKKDAIAQGKKAIEMGQEYYDSRGTAFTYRAGLEKDLASWK